MWHALISVTEASVCTLVFFCFLVGRFVQFCSQVSIEWSGPQMLQLM